MRNRKKQAPSKLDFIPVRRAMTLSNPESTAEYVKDYECLLQGIEFFLRLEEEIQKQRNMHALRLHYEQHPEDKLCHIYKPGTRQMVLCHRSGLEAIDR